MNDKLIGNNIRVARKALKYNQQNFSAKLNISQGYLSDLEAGKSQPSERLLKLIEYHFSINSTWLLTGEGEMFLKLPIKEALHLSPIKVLGRVPAGFPETVSDDDVIEVISLSNVPDGTYGLIVHGGSMGPDIRSGDYAIFVPADRTEVRPGDIVIANNEFGEPMIKRYVLKDGEPFLKSDNPGYPSFKPNEHYNIVGKVIKVWREIKI